MFATVMYCLYLHLGFSRHPDYQGINSSLRRTKYFHIRENSLLLREMVKDSALLYRTTVYDEALLIQQETNTQIAFLEAKAQQLTETAKGENHAAKAAIIDSIQAQIDRFCVFLEAAEISPYSRPYIWSHIPILLHRADRASITDRHLPLRKLLVSVPRSQIKPLITAVINQVLVSQELITRTLYYDAMPGCILSFNAFQAIAVPDKRHVFYGESVQAIVMLASYNHNAKPAIEANEGTVERSERGVATWWHREKTLGEKKISGTASLMQDTEKVTRPWSFKYLVLEKGAAIELDKANTCYAGIPNPVSISVPGYEAGKLRLRVKGAVVRKVPDGRFELIPDGKQKQLLAYIDAENAAGKVSRVGGRKLMVKALPPPVVSVPGIAGGWFSVQDFKGIEVKPADEDLQQTYHVLSYSLMLVHGKEVFGPVVINETGLATNPEAQNLLRRATSGDKLIVDDVELQGSNGIKYYPSFVSCLVR